MKGCELCDRPARMYCESDQASLCWECDVRVHGANFLVARHTRILLCRRCQAPTPWRASGARLGGPTFSVCDRCCCGGDGGGAGKVEEVRAREAHDEQDDVVEEEENRGEDLADEEDEEEEEEEEEDNGDDEDGDNQVVPWTLPPPPPPPVASASTSEESSSRIGNGCTKRMRENADPACSRENRTCSLSQPRYVVAAVEAAVDEEATSFHPSKDRRRSGEPASGAIQIRNRRNMWTFDFVSSGPRSPPI